MPARLVGDADAGLTAELSPARPSGDPFSLVRANGYALIPEGQEPGARRQEARRQEPGEARGQVAGEAAREEPGEAAGQVAGTQAEDQ